MMNTTSTVFIVDDDDAVRKSLALLMQSAGLPVESFASAREFLTRYDAYQPGCVVLDVRMPEMTGLELQEYLNIHGAIIPVIFITGHGDVPMAVEAMRAGAYDFLQKPFLDADLLERIRRALEQDRANRTRLQQHDAIQERLVSLTPREREILDLVTSGKPNKVMAAQLGVSQRTVEIHRARVMEKMGASSLAQLVRMVMDRDRRHA
jgi:two-component system, LuxR family, response regulator FixJ